MGLLAEEVGIVRQVDHLGRIVIPKEIRESCRFKAGTPLEILVENNKIILKLDSHVCSICESSKNLESWKKGKICKECLSEIKNLK